MTLTVTIVLFSTERFAKFLEKAFSFSAISTKNVTLILYCIQNYCYIGHIKRNNKNAKQSEFDKSLKLHQSI